MSSGSGDISHENSTQYEQEEDTAIALTSTERYIPLFNRACTVIDNEVCETNIIVNNTGILLSGVVDNNGEKICDEVLIQCSATHRTELRRNEHKQLIMDNKSLLYQDHLQTMKFC
jgi:hypothetical protein